MTGLEFLIPFLLCLTLVLILRKKFFTKKEENTPLRQKDIKKMKKQEKRKI